MTIIVETGAIVVGANSYVTLAQVDAWMASRNITAWDTAADEVKEAAIIIGQMSMDSKYLALYFGFPVSRNQNMAWPRTRTKNNPYGSSGTQEPVIDRYGFSWAINEIPTAVKNGAYEAIRVEFEGTFTPTTITRDDYIKRKRLDVLETEWFDHTPTSSVAILTDQSLYPIADSAAAGMMVMRIDIAPWEQSCYYYDSAYSLNMWSGDGSYMGFGGWEPYRDLCYYFYQQKSW